MNFFFAFLLSQDIWCGNIDYSCYFILLLIFVSTPCCWRYLMRCTSSLEARQAVGGRRALAYLLVGGMFACCCHSIYFICKINLNICWRSLAMLGIIGVARH